MTVRFVGQRPALPQGRTGNVCVQPPRGAGVPLALGESCRGDSAANLGRRLRSTERVEHLVGPNRLDVPGDVDAIRDRAADPSAVLPALDLGARAPVVPVGGVVVPARTRVAGDHEHRPVSYTHLTLPTI